MIAKLINYINYNLKEKWRFSYLECSLNEDVFFLKSVDESIVFRKANKHDIKKIKEDMYCHLTSIEQNDKKYIERIGDDDFICFIAEKNGVVVHYFLVYSKALNSPLIKTPFNKNKIIDRDAYLGSTFTVPSARGMWVAPYSISLILSYLRDVVGQKKVYVIVHKDTLGAKDFYIKLGFNEVRKIYVNSFLLDFISK